MMRVKAAYRLVATASRAALERRSVQAAGISPIALLVIRASLALYAADVDRSLLLLRRAAAAAGTRELPYVLDLMASLYVTLEDPDHVAEVLEALRPPVCLVPAHLALRSILASFQHDLELSRQLREDAGAALERCGDRLIEARTLQRLALAAYRVGDAEAATELALRSARRCGEIGANRIAMAAYSVAYNVHQAITGDLECALDFAELMIRSARLCGNESYEHLGFVARYEMLAELGDDVALAKCRRALRARALPQQYHERFASGIGDLLPLAWRGDFSAFRAGVTILGDAIARTVGERALCASLGALAHAALGEDEEARRLARSTAFIADLRAQHDLTPAEARYRLLAHVLAAAACLIVGDSFRGRRMLQGKAVRRWVDGSSCLAVLDGASWSAAAPRLRGYARLLQSARTAASERRPPIGLTPVELDVLRLLGDGMSAPQIATETRRSVHTVRAHTRSIIAKFGVNGRYAAVRQAREMGLLG